ncbi:DMT family transporter [Novosphingobium terrae]|uniref:DMT family transporter n=1 Tax=Novosphingobium terrae TaxID=2726189 RepID=UPI001F13FB6B|nr:EamA family transporter [Novosphingobium terrae]
MSGDTATKTGFSTQDILGFATVSLMWGSTWLVIKDQIGFLPIGWTVTIRFTVAALGMFLLARFRGEDLSLNRQRFLLALAVGFLQFCGNFQLVYRAEHYVTSGLVAVMYALLMLPNAILARIFLGARITKRFMAGTSVAAIGIALLMIQEYRHAPPSGAMNVALGVGFAIAGTLCASGANVLQASSIGRKQAVVPLIAWSMLLGAVIDAVMAMSLYGAPVLSAPPRFWAGVAWLAIMGSVVTFPVYFNLIRSIGAGRAAYSNAVVPIVAMALSTFFEGYRWTALAAVGAVVTLSGVLIALSGRKG